MIENDNNLLRRGTTVLKETEQVLKGYGFGASNAEAAFEKHDADRDGAIDGEQFRLLLCEEGVVEPAEGNSKPNDGRSPAPDPPIPDAT